MIRFPEVLITFVFISYFIVIISGIEFINRKILHYMKSKIEINGTAILSFIIFSYPFYLIGLLNYFIIIIFVIGLYNIYQRLINYKIERISSQKTEIIITLYVVFAILFGQSFDSLFHYSQNHPDALSTLEWWDYLSKDTNPGYPSGLLLLSSGILNTFDLTNYINFLGLAVGIVVSLEAYRTLRRFMQQKSLQIFFLVILLPIFNSIIFTRIGFNAGQLTFLLIIQTIVVILKTGEGKFPSIHFGIILISGLLIQPHLLMLWIFPFLLTVEYFKRKNVINKVGKIYIFIISFFIFLIIYYLLLSDNSLATFGLEDFNLDFYNPNLVSELIEIIWSIIQIKGPIRPPYESLISLGSYIAIIFILFSLSLSKERTLVALGIFTLCLGIITNTGILEIEYFKGRIGIYFFYAFVIFFLIIIEKIKFSNRIYNPVILILGMIILIDPPKSYRIYDERIYFSINSLESKEFKTSIYTQFDSMEAIHPRFIATRIDSNINNSNLNLNYYLIMKNKPQLIALNNSSILADAKLSNQLAYSDRDISRFYESKKKEININRFNNNLLKQLLLKNNYRIVVNESEYLILELDPP